MDIYADVQIDGKSPGTQLSKIQIRQDLFSPCEITITLAIKGIDPESAFDNAINSWFGKLLNVMISDNSDSKISKYYEGYIGRIELSETYIKVIAYSEDKKLGYSKKHRSYENLSIQDVVEKILNNYSFSLPSKISTPPKSLTFDFLHQYDETDIQFIKRIAQYDGCVFYNDGEQFVYEYKMVGTEYVEIGLQNIINCELQCSMHHINFRGVPYNSTKHNEPKHLLVDSGQFEPPDHPFEEVILNKSEELLQENNEIYNKPINNRAEFETYLKNRQDMEASSHIIIKGIVDHPMVAIGRSVQCPKHPILKNTFVITNLFTEFDGSVYTTKFQAVPHNSVVRATEIDERSYLGLLQPGMVIDDNDPLNLGRVQIQYLWDTEDNAHAWSRVINSGAGSDHGSHWTPRKGDQVLVGIEHGDPSLPVVLGVLYHSESKPDFKTENGTEEVLLAKTTGGSEIRLVDAPGKEYILLSMEGGKNLIRMDLKGPQITIESVDGTIEVKADKKIVLTSKEIQLTADSKLILESRAEAELKAQSSVKVSSAQVESSASANNIIKGNMVQIN